MPTFIDLFAGAAGLSEGFMQQGFTPLVHVEMGAMACQTIRTRLAYHHLRGTPKYSCYNDYLLGRLTRPQLHAIAPAGLLDGVLQEELSDQGVEGTVRRAAERVAAAGVSRVDVLLGGAPCQAYSLIGRFSKKEKPRDDPRLGLYRHYVRFLREFTPLDVRLRERARDALG